MSRRDGENPNVHDQAAAQDRASDGCGRELDTAASACSECGDVRPNPDCDVCWDDGGQAHPAASSSHQLAYGILVAARGEHEADELWNDWTPADRRCAAEAAENFRPILQRAADDLVAWLRAG